jgi:hypothetical protein
MKNRYLSILLIVLISMGFLSCEVDNIPGPDALLTGRIIDDLTDSLVQQDLISGSSLDFWEAGYDPVTKISLSCKVDGTYTNNMMFSGTYLITTPNANWYPVDSIKGFILKPGQNTYDFRVTPYIRVKDANIVVDTISKTIVAKFKLEGGQLSTTIKTLTLCAHPDPRVAKGMLLALQAPSGKPWEKTFNNTSIPMSEQTLTIPLASNTTVLKSKKTYYFRIAALTGVTGARENYSKAVAIQIP